MPFLRLVICIVILFFFFFFNDTATTEIYTLSLHDALPISSARRTVLVSSCGAVPPTTSKPSPSRSEEHTSELQSRSDLVCRLLLETKKNKVQGRLTRSNNRKHQK